MPRSCCSPRHVYTAASGVSGPLRCGPYSPAPAITGQRIRARSGLFGPSRPEAGVVERGRPTPSSARADRVLVPSNMGTAEVRPRPCLANPIRDRIGPGTTRPVSRDDQSEFQVSVVEGRRFVRPALVGRRSPHRRVHRGLWGRGIREDGDQRRRLYLPSLLVPRTVREAPAVSASGLVRQLLESLGGRPALPPGSFRPIPEEAIAVSAGSDAGMGKGVISASSRR
jgi:hypothetical protein